MNAPKISIIVPVYRAEPWLERCVRSLQDQTLEELEIILVDDGSPDGCPAICDRLAAEDTRIRVLHKVNEGAGPSRSAGLALARGEFAGFVDSDDFVEPQMFETLWNAARTWDADLVLSGEYNLGYGGEKHSFSRTEVFEGPEGMEKLLLGIVGALPEEAEDSRYGFAVWKNLYRLSLLRENDLRFSSERKVLSEDALFLMDVASHSRRAVGVPGVFYHYCVNGASVSKGFRSDRLALCRALMEEMERRLSGQIPRERYLPYLDRQFLAQIRTTALMEIAHARTCGIPDRDLDRQLRQLCSAPDVQTVLRRYPWRRLPAKQAVFAFSLRYRLVWLQKLLADLRRKGQSAGEED